MKKILIIEDNVDVRENTADILEMADYKVLTAQNGKVGVEIAKQQHPDIIICDIMMPELDGYEVLKTLREHSNTSQIPFIFLTAKTEKIDMRKGMNLGADDYLTKPFTDNELLEAIDCRLKKHDFLKKEFSRNIEGVSKFIEEASAYLDLEHLSRDFTPKIYQKKDLVFMEGDTANSLYFIESGAIKTYKTTERGKEFVTGLYGSGDFIGQLSLLTDHRTYIESASVLEDAALYEIPQLDFLTLIHGNKAVSNKFVNLISNDLVEVQEKLVSMAYATVRQRVAKALLDLHKKRILTSEENEGISIAREDFAGLVGTATETSIRMLTELKDEGLITIGSGRKIKIKDKKALENIVVFN
ncbi:response regulator [Algibacter agarivorans]|uniref:Response regulator n=1 Tax=Algibacter agarivorans TaxID=1109741 RepID=A0ABP9GKV0_9FLAO